MIKNLKHLAFLTLILFSARTSAQNFSKNAIGIRVGDSDGFGTEVSYQRRLSDKTRLELDLGWRDNNDFDAIKVSGIYQWIYPIQNRLNWFVGAGGSIGYFDDNRASNNDEAFVAVSGDIGIEYSFKVPLQIALDMRPEISFNDTYSDGINTDLALAIRYQF
ncbi:hypothetical protein ACXGQW_11135 [Wenyingzhuangia sp. IMCC45533]